MCDSGTAVCNHWTSHSTYTYCGHGLHALVCEQLREQLGVEVAHANRLCVPSGHRFLKLDVALDGVRHRVAPAELDSAYDERR